MYLKQLKPGIWNEFLRQWSYYEAWRGERGERGEEDEDEEEEKEKYLEATWPEPSLGSRLVAA